MKLFGEILLGAVVMAVLGAVLVHCDVARAQNVNTFAPATINAPSIPAPEVAVVTTVIEEPEVWDGMRRLTTETDGCAEYSAHRAGERTRYRVRACRDGSVTTLSRIR